MDVLFNCFVIGLICGVPVWILMQYLRPRIQFLGLPTFGGGLEPIHIDPVVLDGRFVASVAYALDVAQADDAAGAVQAAP